MIEKPHGPAAWLAGLASIERALVCGAFALMVGVVFADVLARELGSGGLPWARQTGVWANIVVAMFGVGLASGSGAHLRPRFADGWLPASWEPVLERVGEVLTAGFCWAFAALAASMAFESMSFGEKSAILRVPVWPVQGLIGVAFVTAGVRHFLFAIWPELRPKPSNVFVSDAQSR